MVDPLRIAVLGPGGVGGLLAAVLARAGHDVTVLARPATAEHIAAHGLELESGALGSGHVDVGAAARLDRAVDAVLVTVKATQLDEALDSLPADALGSAIVVPFLNGIDHVDRLRSVYPPDQVVAATIRVEAERVAPGRVAHLSPFAIVELGVDTPSEQVGRLAEALEGAGLTVAVREGERQVLWDKLAVLAPLALFTTLAAAPWGVVRQERWAQVEQVVGELAAAADADGARVDAAQVLGFLQQVPEGMRSSMQKDAAAGNPLELDAIGGAPLRVGAAAGVPMPALEELVSAVRAVTGASGDSGADHPRR